MLNKIYLAAIAFIFIISYAIVLGYADGGDSIRQYEILKGNRWKSL